MNESLLKSHQRCNLLRSENVTKNLDKALTLVEELSKRVQLQEDEIKEKEFVNNELMVAFGLAKKDKESTKEEYTKLAKKYSQLEEEMKMNKKTVDIINDHILELQFENELLHQQLKKQPT